MRKNIEDVLVKCMHLENSEPIDATRLFFFDNISECFDAADIDKLITLGNNWRTIPEAKNS